MMINDDVSNVGASDSSSTRIIVAYKLNGEIQILYTVIS